MQFIWPWKIIAKNFVTYKNVKFGAGDHDKHHDT